MMLNHGPSVVGEPAALDIHGFLVGAAERSEASPQTLSVAVLNSLPGSCRPLSPRCFFQSAKMFFGGFPGGLVARNSWAAADYVMRLGHAGWQAISLAWAAKAEAPARRMSRAVDVWGHLDFS